MTDIRFELVDEPFTEGTDPLPDTCPCPDPDDQYLMEIDGGSVSITHRACGKPPAWHGDWVEALTLDSTPVRIQWDRPGCDGQSWHYDNPCDCDSYAVLTINGLAHVHEGIPATATATLRTAGDR